MADGDKKNNTTKMFADKFWEATVNDSTIGLLVG